MISKLSRYIQGSTWIFVVAAPLLMVVEVLCDLMQPTLMSQIIDVGVASGDMAEVWRTGGIMISVAFIGILGGVGCTATSSVAAMRFGAALRKGMFDNIQTFSFREIDRFKTSSLITRLTNDVTQMQNMLRSVLCMLVRAPLSCIGGLVMAFAMSRQLSIIFVVAIPLLLGGMLVVIPKTFPMFAKMQEKIDRVNTVMRENLLGVRVVKAFVGQEREKKRFNVANEDLMRWTMKAMKIIMISMPIVTLVMNLSVLALLLYGGLLTVQGSLEVGKIMAFMTYMMQVLSSLMMVVLMLMNVSRAKVSGDRILEVLETRTSIESPRDPKEMQRDEICDEATGKRISGLDVEFDHVSFRYDEADPEYVLKDINFKAHPGQTIGIIGGTGSGKSTFINLIPRLYDVSEGSVRIGGVDVRELSLDDLRQHIGVVLQDSVLFSGTIEENLKWGDENATEAQLDRAAADAQANEFIDKLPERYEAYVEQRGKNFSGGQKQRLSIARTFVKEPDILILDDSTSAVDMATEARIQQALRNREHQGIVFVIAQRISAIRDADQILVMEGGEISGIGTHEELIHTNEIYRAIAVSQLGEEALANV